MRMRKWSLLGPADDKSGGSSAAVVDMGDDPTGVSDDPDNVEEDDDLGADTRAAGGAEATTTADDEDLEELAAGGKRGVKPVPGERVAEMVSKAEKRATAAMQNQIDALQNQIVGLSNPGSRTSPAVQVRNMQAKRDELENEYDTFVFAGKPEGAKAARVQMRQIDAALADYKLDVRTQAARSGAAEDVRYAVVLESVETRYPELDPDHEDYDREKETEVTSLVDGIMATGVSKDVALKRAVKYVLGERRGSADELAADPDPKMQRTIEARTRAARAAARTPANTEGIGRAPVPNDDKKIDLSRRITPDAFKMFNNMSDTERAKLRGDIAV